MMFPIKPKHKQNSQSYGNYNFVKYLCKMLVAGCRRMSA